MNNKKIDAFALSGGVDSGAAAYILKESGYDVFGVTMKLFDDYDIKGAQYVAKKLGINYYILDYSKCFKDEIINKFIGEYIYGNTPNPCCKITLTKEQMCAIMRNRKTVEKQ